MAISELSTFPITIKEAQNIWKLTKRQVQWAVWRDKVKARQCLFSEAWILDYNSCEKHFGSPKETGLVAEIRIDWHGN